MGVVMVMFRADGQRRSFSITRDMTVVGRREDCDLRIPLSDVSRKHCRLILNGETMKIEDLGSSNGTYINGERVQQETFFYDPAQLAKR
jgi:pSer/pThr/pTyr-binding forkhead associated (FHA) protein